MCNIIFIFVSVYLKVFYFMFGIGFFLRIWNVVFCLGVIWIILLGIMLMFVIEFWGEFFFLNYVFWCYLFIGGFGIFVVCFVLIISFLVLLFFYVGIIRIVL